MGQYLVGKGGGGVAAAFQHAHLQNVHTLIYKHTHSLAVGGQAAEGTPLLLPVVAELDGGAVEDAAEGDRLHLPVRYGVAEQADAGVHGLLAVESRRTEVFRADGGDLVDVEVDHLEGGINIMTASGHRVGLCAEASWLFKIKRIWKIMTSHRMADNSSRIPKHFLRDPTLIPPKRSVLRRAALIMPCGVRHCAGRWRKLAVAASSTDKCNHKSI